MIREWIGQGHAYNSSNAPNLPIHPHITASQASKFCIINFPTGYLLAHRGEAWVTTVGTERGQLMPGTYRYRAESGDDRVNHRSCKLRLNSIPPIGQK